MELEEGRELSKKRFKIDLKKKKKGLKTGQCKYWLSRSLAQ